MIGPSDFYEIMAKSPPNIELNKNVTETFSGLADFSLITVIVTVQPILRWGGGLTSNGILSHSQQARAW